MRTRGRRRRQLLAAETVSESVSVDLPCAAEQLWEFMWDPASALIHTPGTQLATTLAGTPKGAVGEVQVVLGSHGDRRWLTALEVVEVDPPRLAVTRSLTDVVEAGGRLEISSPTPHTSRLIQSFYCLVQAGGDVELVTLLRSTYRERLEELRAALVTHFSI